MESSEKFEEYDPPIKINKNPSDEEIKIAQGILDKYKKMKSEKNK